MDRRPASAGTTLLLLVASIATSIVLTGWIEADTGDELRGRLACVETVVRAPSSGRVSDQLTRPGERVRAGESLILVEDETSRERAAELKREIATLDAEIDRLRARIGVESSWRLREIDREIHEAELRAADLLRQRFDEEVGSIAWSELADSTATAFEDGGANPVVEPITGIAPPRRGGPLRTSVEEGGVHVEALLRSERSRNAIEVFDAQIELCEARIETLQEIRGRVAAGVEVAHGLPKHVADREQLQRELDQLGGTDGSRAIVAPGFGEVDEVSVAAGDVVEAGQAVATIVDRARTFVELPIPSSRLDELAEGTAVHVLFPNGVKRLGRVDSVTARAMVPETANGSTGDSYVLARIAPVGKLWPSVPLGTSLVVTGPAED